MKRQSTDPEVDRSVRRKLPKATMESTPPLAALALALTAQDWTSLGLGDDPSVAATSDVGTIVERLTSLLLVRIVALAMPMGGRHDLSTTAICRSALVTHEPWPEPVTEEVTVQLRAYVRKILQGYNTVPYHSAEHCYHVTLSMNKLVDLTLNTEIQGKVLPPSFGFRRDPLMQLALVFSALIHDVEHQGIPNRQLAIEDDELAILYNDQSIAENRSLHIGFSELLKPEFKELRDAMFSSREEYRRFRKTVLNIVLGTDIASPERTQLGKSKWKEAFGEEFETLERKVKNEMKRRNSLRSGGTPTYGRRASGVSINSLYSEITTDIPEEYNLDEESPSITPDSSVEGDAEDDMYLQDDPPRDVSDGIVITSKPFSNVFTRSGPGDEESNIKQNQLGYEPAQDGEQATRQSFVSTGPIYDPMKKYGNSKPAPPGPGRLSRINAQSRSMSDVARSTASSLPGSQPPPVADNIPAPKATFNKFQRRFSTSTVQGATTKRYKYRLGILRSVDLSGEAIETYSRGSGTGAMTSEPTKSLPTDIEEEVDELKMIVFMEQLMGAADVAHNLQGWDQMVKWSNRLFLELKKAYKEGRGGSDPRNRWFENQIGFLESYLLPLARRLEDCGVFGEVIGPVFATVVEQNRDRWLLDGLGVTSAIILEGAKQYPVETDNV